MLPDGASNPIASVRTGARSKACARAEPCHAISNDEIASSDRSLPRMTPPLAFRHYEEQRALPQGRSGDHTAAVTPRPYSFEAEKTTAEAEKTTARTRRRPGRASSRAWSACSPEDQLERP